ncbi:MAG: gfo/Idh/MocA family oxidoreductase [Opitutales bacterium]|nr:gfo/Idh/MocA family oxidoreductase [Opitutales bacterium]
MQRRDFVKSSAILGSASALAGCSSMFANVKGSDRIKVGLIGCGGRGRGAVCNMMNADQNIEIVALADLFPEKIESALQRIVKESKKFGKQANDIINPDSVKKFVGINCEDGLLATDVDVVIDACSPVFRTPHFAKIVAAGKHAFLEKPACIDATQARQCFEISKIATQKGLSVVCGTQRRYHAGYQEMIDRIQDGQIGDLVSAQCYWNDGRYVGHSQRNNTHLAPDTMEYQIRNWFSFIWASGDHIVEQHVHNLDVIMWALGDKRFPKEVRGWGGRSTDLPIPDYGDRFSHFAVDFDMGNGLRLESYCHQDPKTAREQGERLIGTKGIMYSSLGGRIYITDKSGKLLWEAPEVKVPCLVSEHKFLLDSIRSGKRVNKVDQLVNSTLLAIAGRMSAFSGKKFKFDWVLAKSKENLCPEKIEFAKKMQWNGVPVPGKFQLI